MKRIGLTGGIATGKSTVSQMLTELGAVVIDADRLAREVVRQGCPAWQDIVAWFGRDVLLPNGEIDRAKLGQVIFSDSTARVKLNEFTHPRVIARMNSMLSDMAEQGHAEPVVLDVPLLIEANMAESVDEVWLVVANPNVQLERLMRRNRLSEAEARARILAQMPLAEKRSYAHRIIDNSGSMEDTRKQVALLWKEARQSS